MTRSTRTGSATAGTEHQLERSHLYFSLRSLGCVLAVRDGMLERVAGRCDSDHPYVAAGDGGPALEALLHRPSGLAVSPDGTWLYIVDAYYVRAVKLKEGPRSPAMPPDF